MKIIRFITILLLICLTQNSYGQDQGKKIGFYFQPFYSAMFLEGHVGNAVGFNTGITSKNKKWDVGIRFYGRSGPINNHQEYELVLPEGRTYKGKSTLNLGADHGYFALEVAYILPLAEDRVLLRFPVSFGQLGAGFYLKGDDRITPDGRRVNEWEDELQDGTDAGFGLSSEVGIQAFYQPFPNVPLLRIGAGLHFANTYGYESFLGGNDFYNNKLRADIGLRVAF